MIEKKIHKNNMGQVIVSLCDSDLLGKEFSEGKFILDVKESFYKSDESSDEQVDKALSKATSINAIGKESVSFLIEKNLLDKESVKRIDDVKYAFIVLE